MDLRFNYWNDLKQKSESFDKTFFTAFDSADCSCSEKIACFCINQIHNSQQEMIMQNFLNKSEWYTTKMDLI